MRPENHTLLDCNTLDEYSDLKRLEMVFTSLPAGGLLDTLCYLCSGGGRNDRTLEPMLKVGIARIVWQHPSVEWFRRELQRNPLLMLADFGTHQGFDGKALESHSTGNDIPGKGETSDVEAR